MWIVAAALVGGVGARSALPDLPPRLGYGVEALGPRLEFKEPGIAGPVVPTSKHPMPALVAELPRTPGFAEVVQNLTKRMIGCDRPETAA